MLKEAFDFSEIFGQKFLSERINRNRLLITKIQAYAHLYRSPSLRWLCVVLLYTLKN